jgi:hypothetical protein
MTTLASIVDWDALSKVILYSLVTGVGVTVVFSVGIVGLTRYDEIRRQERTGSSFAYGALALIAAVVTIAVVVEAIIVMARK